MTIHNKKNVPVFIIPLLFLFLLQSCDIEFGSSDDDDGNQSEDTMLTGQIEEIIPSRDTEGITVEVEDENSDFTFEDITDSSGFFEVVGGFCGNSIISFLDEDGDSLGNLSIDIFPGAEIDLGGLEISTSSVTLLDDIFVEFIGDVIENSCDGTGSIIVEIDHDCGDEVEVLVNIDSSVDITIENNDIDCEDIELGEEVTVEGVLVFGNTVDAEDIEIEDD